MTWPDAVFWSVATVAALVLFIYVSERYIP